MSTLNHYLQDYLLLNRSLGLKYQEQEKMLQQFVVFMAIHHANQITCELALEWAKQTNEVKPARWATRLSYVRGFARFLRLNNLQAEIPPSELMPAKYTRTTPYIYNQDEIQRLMTAAKALPSAVGLKSQSYYCLFGLLISTGLRIGEALALTVDDVDLHSGLLTIKGAKFGKSRLVPLHPSAKQALSSYVRKRDKCFSSPLRNHFFVSERGCRLWSPDVRNTFYKLSREIGLRGVHDHTGPRLHDFRHCFAVQTLLRWYRNGENVESCLPALSTYLGHRNLQDTFWYLQACPELMNAAVEKLNVRWEKKP